MQRDRGDKAYVAHGGNRGGSEFLKKRTTSMSLRGGRKARGKIFGHEEEGGIDVKPATPISRKGV